MINPTYTAFVGERRLASGTAQEVASQMAKAHAAGAARLLVFDDATGEQAELDPRGHAPTIVGRSTAQPRSRGRPKLGVTSREVTLLPRHWEWLAAQRGGASAALRRLVEDVSRAEGAGGSVNQERVYRVMSALAGSLPGFEEATRALFASDGEALQGHLEKWPADIRAYLQELSLRIADAAPGRIPRQPGE